MKKLLLFLGFLLIAIPVFSQEKVEINKIRIRNDLVVESNIVAKTFTQADVTWIDLMVPGLSFNIGASAPQLNATGTGKGIEAIGFDNIDIGYGSVQMPHGLALTNSSRSVLFIEPHVHWSLAVAPTPPNTNVTFRLIYEWGNINDGGFTTFGTNSITVGRLTATNSFVSSFGNITNNGAGISSIFRFKLTRPASASNDYGNSHDVLVDDVDVHVPIDRNGSANQYTQ
jgi:hypothetical protein